MKKLYIMMGAHRKTGYTRKALDYLLSQIPDEYEVTVDYAIDKKVAYCKSCYYCETHKGECILKDDMTQIYENFLEADMLIFISPIYFSSAPSALKTILDRTQMFYCHGKYDVPEKDVYVLGVGGAPAYDLQFKCLMENLKHLLIYINGKVRETLFYPQSDKYGGDFTGENKEKLVGFVKKIFD